MPYDHIRILNTLFASGVWFEMTLAEVRVYVAICGHWNWNTLEAFPTINTLAEEVRLSRRDVIYAISKLEAKGLIRIVKKGRKNFYQLFDYLFKMAGKSKGTKSALIEWIGADFEKKGEKECTNRCIPVHHHINYTINNKTITNYFDFSKEANEPEYIRQMRSDLMASGRY